MTKETRALLFSSTISVFLTVIKMLFGVITGSLAVLSSAVDSLSDIFISGVNFLSQKQSDKPQDEKHNYWYGKIQGICAFLEGLFFVIVGLGIIYLAVSRYISWEWIIGINALLYVMIFAISSVALLVLYLRNIAQNTRSLIIKAELLHYEMDLFTNLGIIISLLLIKFTGIYEIDLIISVIIAIYIIYTSGKILLQWFNMLMDRSIDQKYINEISDIINNSKQVKSFHKLKTRRSGNDIFVEVDLVFEPEIKLITAHNQADQIIEKIQKNIPNSFVKVHLDPVDDSWK